MVEAALVLPLTLLILLGMFIGGLGVFRYQEVAFLAREGSRYASVHGSQYAKEVSGATAATPQDIYDNAIAPRIVCLDLSQLTYSVTWNTSNDPYTMTSNYEKPLGNTVSVTVSYQWFPELYLIGPYTLSSTSTVPMMY
jgi:Flp pilus assembly protein TadG